MADARSTVSEKDREHFRRWGELKRLSHEDARRMNLERPAGERLVASIVGAMALSGLNRWGGQSDVPLARHQRAKDIGLARR